MTLRPIAVCMVVALEGAAFAAPSAEDLFYEGEVSYARDDFADAAAKWSESYALSKEPELLFSIAQALRLDGRCAEALATYRRFVAMLPGHEKRPLADQFVRELTPNCGTANVAPRESRPIEPPEPLLSDPGRTLKVAGVVTAGTGAALVLTGLLFGRRASTLGDEVTSACSNPNDPCNWDVERNKDATGRRYATIGYTLDVLGVAAVAGGAVMYYLGNRQSRVTVSPTGRDGGAVLSWGGRW